MFGAFPAKNTVHTPYIYIYIYGFGTVYDRIFDEIPALLYICAVYDRIFDKIPAKNTVYIYMVLANPTYIWGFPESIRNLPASLELIVWLSEIDYKPLAPCSVLNLCGMPSQSAGIS